jgi:hypothetical protein
MPLFFKSNAEYWDYLNREDILYSLLKDGIPHTFVEKVIAGLYPITLCIIICCCIIAFKKLKYGQRKWKTWLFSITLGTLTGGIWCFVMQKFDPLFPGWIFPPWSVTGAELGLVIEDLIFLPASTTLFYAVYRFVTIADFQPSNRNRLFFLIFFVYTVLSIFCCIGADIAGRTEVLAFILPALVLYIYARNTINMKHFLILQLCILGFEVLWDLYAVSLLHRLPGMAWSSQWTYIVFNDAGRYFHSKIFLDYGTHRWAWLLDNPVEITPLFGICGGILNCCMFAAGDRFFYRQTTA